jgi:hypothetical protein
MIAVINFMQSPGLEKSAADFAAACADYWQSAYKLSGFGKALGETAVFGGCRATGSG